MVKLNNEVLQQRLQIIELSASKPEEIEIAKSELEKKLQQRWIMIAGEGTVFLILLISGFLQTRRTFKKEADLTTRQRNFLLSVTHELKSPIASSKLQIETLLKRELSKEKQVEILNHALSDTERLHALVENVLIATRLEDSSHKLVFENSDLSDFMTKEIEKLSKHHQIDTPHKAKLDIPNSIFFPIDSFAFVSILTNLYENALKYSGSDPEITISLKQIGTQVFIAIADNGIGIEEAESSKIFEKFYRIGSEETRKSKGTGLGLYIVKQLVQAHKGTIKVKKNSPKGSIFEITLSA
jgi:K+-sensing histidine kinase KdpD